MKKIDVFGENADPIFKYLTSQVPEENVQGEKKQATMKMVETLTSGRKKGDKRWNFTKFLISRDGRIIKRYAPVTTPEEIEKDIEAML